MTFSEKLKSLRLKRGLSQEELAKLLNVSLQDIIRWESQNDIPSIDNLKLIAKIFNVTIDSLVYEEENIENIYQSFPWDIAWTFGIIGMIISSIWEETADHVGSIGLCLGIVGYLIGQIILIFKSKRYIYNIK